MTELMLTKILLCALAALPTGMYIISSYNALQYKKEFAEVPYVSKYEIASGAIGLLLLWSLIFYLVF